MKFLSFFPQTFCTIQIKTLPLHSHSKGVLTGLCYGVMASTRVFGSLSPGSNPGSTT